MEVKSEISLNTLIFFDTIVIITFLFFYPSILSTITSTIIIFSCLCKQLSNSKKNGGWIEPVKITFISFRRFSFSIFSPIKTLRHLEDFFLYGEKRENCGWNVNFWKNLTLHWIHKYKLLEVTTYIYFLIYVNSTK